MKQVENNQNATDFFGRKLEVGQEVAFMQLGYRYFRLGKVQTISHQTLTISRSGIEHDVRQFHNQVIIKL